MSWYANPSLIAEALENGIRELGSKGKVFKWLCEPNAHYDNRALVELLEEGGISAGKVLQFMMGWSKTSSNT